MSCTVLELFAGIGGLSCAWPEARTVAAVDISRNAQQVYRQNFASPYLIREIASMKPRDFAALTADVWWLSPPCQPYSGRGKQRDVEDSRATALTRLSRTIADCLPTTLALENVPGFEHSQSYAQLTRILDEHDYRRQQIHLCPTQMNWPNRRNRFYLLASRKALLQWQPVPQYLVCLEQMIDRNVTPGEGDGLWLAPHELERFETAIDRIDYQQLRTARTACFASSYGKAIVGSGSYLAHGNGRRRFTPREVARQLGFPDCFALDGISPRAAWRLLGNSLSLPAVRYILSHLPGGPTGQLPWSVLSTEATEAQPCTSAFPG